MADLRGTNVAAPVVPFSSLDKFPTHEAQYGKGGYRSVATYEDMLAIPEARREEGMFVYVLNDTHGIGNYQYIGGQFVRAKVGGGIPVVTQEVANNLGIDVTRDEAVFIPSKNTDLNGSVDNHTYTTTVNGNYVDVLFQALRQLQTEVAKLRNSFKYGIESYSGKNTAMSGVMEDFGDELPEEEPLWAVEEDGLSDLGIDELVTGTAISGDNVEVITDPATLGTFLKIRGEAGWDVTQDVKVVQDSKIFMYVTMKGKKLKAKLNVYDPADNQPFNGTDQEIDFNRIGLDSYPARDYYNILMIISRTQQLSDGDGTYFGKNFIWISIADADTGVTLREGYVKFDDPETLFESVKTFSENERYNFTRIEFEDTTLSKFKFYSRYQDFSNNVIASKPSDETYKYKVAHLTIRAVDSQAELASIKDQLLENELIWNTGTNKLWIKSNNNLVAIGSAGSGGEGGNTDSGMTREEMIEALQEMGIIQENNGDIKINQLALEDITFIHTGTDSRYKYSIDSEGKLVSTPVAKKENTFEARLENFSPEEDIRGFIGQLRASEAGITGNGKTKDIGLNSDRLKIGAVYAPLKSDTIHGCTHSFIELENTADVDFPLIGCYLHYTCPDNNGVQQTYHLALDGIIPAGGTYLVRGARHTSDDNANAFIKVKSFDQEWFVNGNPLSFEINDLSSIGGYGFCLTYGNSWNGRAILADTQLVRATVATDTVTGISSMDTTAYPNLFICPYFIDGIYLYRMVTGQTGAGYWATTAVGLKNNTMYRNMFQLDPAKQAFQAFTTKDSSRTRWASTNDIMVLNMDKEEIAFPHTDAVLPIATFTPKASFEHKNVCTGKTGPDPDKPNMVTCSFGIDTYKTRCFNWISTGYFDEYVWFKTKGSATWEGHYQSYTPTHDITISRIENIVSDGNITGKKATFTVTETGFVGGSNISNYTIMTGLDHSLVASGFTIKHSSGNIYEATLDKGATVGEGNYILHKAGDDTFVAGSHKKFFNTKLNNAAYARISGKFPGNETNFTSHKCILNIRSSHLTSSPVEYIYVVGRADKNGNPDPEHTSEEMSFTIYPDDDAWKPVIYQTTDQQGFHWVEYQVWAAAAKKINEKIEADKGANNANKIIPILVNTGDMTQNGTRINEWMDYYEGGKCLFNHLEQMNVVGNNDLCNTDPEILGTGDDNGKSNSHFFHLFYCYEIDEAIANPVFNNMVNPNAAPKYAPSFYYFDTRKNRFLMMNSELTEVNCKNWFGLVHNSKTVNIYTGFEIDGSSGAYVNGFTSIYTMVHNILRDARTNSKQVIAACHEMPYTVITSESLMSSKINVSRSIANNGNLVGSHLNQISKNEGMNKGVYWFSRLLEHFGVKLCIGGHKHTYACTYPVREYYLYNGTSNSFSNGPMDMESMTTLENDTAVFMIEEGQGTFKNMTKFPITERAELASRTDGGFYPSTFGKNSSGSWTDSYKDKAVIYFMCQATGYKLTSNKELPSPNQSFTWTLPQTTSTPNGDGTFKDSASKEQKYPMFGIIKVDGTSFEVKLARVDGIMVSGKFDQSTYKTDSMSLQWLKEKDNKSDNFGSWVNNETTLFSSTTSW